MTSSLANPPVVITAGRTANSLGVVRAFGRCGVEVVVLDAISESPASFSRYVSQKLRSLPPGASESQYLDTLLGYGRRCTHKPVIIPTGDEEVLAISKHRQALSPYFQFSLADHSLLQSFVEKRRFYRLLEKRGIAHPETCIPDNLLEVKEIGNDLDFPFLIKPSDSLFFQEQFKRKCFVIKNSEELDRAITMLEGTDLEVMLQEIIPGNEFHEIYFYFNQMGILAAQCGWDRLRQFPPDFGNGTYCKNIFRREPAAMAEAFLGGLSFRGLAAVEFKRDPRDNQYKVLEVNPRTTLQNRLAAACGIDIELMAYLDLTGRETTPIVPPDTGTLWVEDFTDIVSRLRDVLRDQSVPRKQGSRKVRSIACWEDPLPLLARVYFLFLNTARLVGARAKARMSDFLFKRPSNR